MKRLLPLIILLAVVILLAAPTKHLLKSNANGDEFDTTVLDWQEASKALRIQNASGSSFYSEAFSASELKGRSSSSEEWHGVFTFTAMLDTALGTTTTDTSFMNGQADTVYIILEKNTGLHWAVVDTLHWYSEAAVSIDLGDTLFTAADRGEYVFYMTDASRDTSDALFIEAFTHKIHRVKVHYEDSTYVDIQLFVEPY